MTMKPSCVYVLQPQTQGILRPGIAEVRTGKGLVIP